MYPTQKSLAALSARAISRHSSLLVRAPAVSRSFTTSFPSQQATPSSSSWTPPVAPGQNKEYDLALSFIQSQAKAQQDSLPSLNSRIEELKEKVEVAKKSAEEGNELDLAVLEELSELQNEKERVESLSLFHDPKTRWEFENGLLDPSTPIARYLAREKFELGGSLDLHTNALNEMYVIPDLIAPPSKGLQVDLVLRYPVSAPTPSPRPDKFGYVKKVRKVETRDAKDGNRVICGRMLPVEETLKEPELEIRYFGENDTLGTLFMIDLDVPDLKNHTFQSHLHWLVPNIPLSAKSQIFPSSNPLIPSSSSPHKASLPPAVLPYLPPHPHKGTPYHRYAFVLVQHDEPLVFGETKERDVIQIPKREGFQLRRFLHDKKWALKDVVGMSFVREIYDAKVCPQIWEEIIQKPEEKFFVGQPRSLYWTPDKKNRAQIYNQELGIVGTGPDMDARFIRTPGWDKDVAEDVVEAEKEETTTA